MLSERAQLRKSKRISPMYFKIHSCVEAFLAGDNCSKSSLEENDVIELLEKIYSQDVLREDRYDQVAAILSENISDAEELDAAFPLIYSKFIRERDYNKDHDLRSTVLVNFLASLSEEMRKAGALGRAGIVTWLFLNGVSGHSVGRKQLVQSLIQKYFNKFRDGDFISVFSQPINLQVLIKWSNRHGVGGFDERDIFRLNMANHAAGALDGPKLNDELTISDSLIQRARGTVGSNKYQEIIFNINAIREKEEERPVKYRM